MNVRAQISMVFHLDKCIGCHTCSISCKHLWTDRKGAEYMWWNNVETKPGTGYPHRWEDQERYRGGWVKDGNGNLRLRLHGKLGGLLKLFYNPSLPNLKEYYEPWTYRYEDLFDSPQGDDQPTAIPVSMITGKPIDINRGPNWDDDFSGSPEYAKNDINLENLSEEDKKFVEDFQRIAFFYIPRICNHCLNPSCVAACPQGAIYKRGEDGIVLVNQEKCRGWRMCISGCPYKKVYYNWETGKSEKCILCYPRVETGQAPACFHSCVGRIRYLGVLLYDADRIHEVAASHEKDLMEKQMEIILDPFDEKVIEGAKENGIPDDTISAAQKSPVFQFVKVYKIAFPLHPEFRTLPMLFYVPPLLPVIAGAPEDTFFTSVDKIRVPLKYLANIFTCGNTAPLEDAYRILLALRLWKKASMEGDAEGVKKAENLAGLNSVSMEKLYLLTAIAPMSERYVIPPSHREQAIDLIEEVERAKGEKGFGFIQKPERVR